MSRIKIYCEDISQQAISNIDELIQKRALETNLYEYCKSFKSIHNLETCKKLANVFEVISTKGYYSNNSFLFKYDNDFLLQLLVDQEVFFLFSFSDSCFKFLKTIFHYQFIRPMEPDDMIDLELENFEPAKTGAIFFSDRAYYYILQQTKEKLQNLKKILEEEKKE